MMLHGWNGTAADHTHAQMVRQLLRNGWVIVIALAVSLPVMADDAATEAQEYRDCINRHLAKKFSAKIAHKKCFKKREATGAGKKVKEKPSAAADNRK
jgi:hypothetical protein